MKKKLVTILFFFNLIAIKNFSTAENIQKEQLKNIKEEISKQVDELKEEDTRADGLFQLALIEYKSKNGNYLKAINFCEEALKNIADNDQKYKLYLDIKILLGRLKTKIGKNEEAILDFKEASKYIKENKLNIQNKINAHEATGDALFNEFKFKQAYESYIEAKKSLNSLDKTDDAIHKIIALEFKLAISSYRASLYKIALKHADYIFELRTKITQISEDNFNKLKELIAFSLYEVGDFNKIVSFLKNDTFDDSKHEIILITLENFYKSGNPQFANKIFNSVQDLFKNKRMYPDFYLAWIESCKIAKDNEKLNDIIFDLSNQLSKNSPWSEKYAVYSDTENKRFELIKNYTLTAGKFFYENGFKKQSNQYFKKSESIFKNRIAEKIPTDDKSFLYEYYIKSQLELNDINKTYLTLKKAFNEEKDLRQDKNLLILSVFVAKRFFIKENEYDINKFNEYFSYVDLLFKNYYKEKSSRYYFLEAINILDKFKNRKLTLTQLDRIFTLFSDNTIIFSDIEKDQIIKTVLNFYEKPDYFSKDELKFIGKCEEYLRTYLPKIDLSSRIFNANFLFILQYSEHLEKNGYPEESLKEITAWINNFSSNKNIPDLLFNGIVIAATSGDWKTTDIFGRTYENKYMKIKYNPLTYYWMAVSFKNQLRFKLAERYFEKFVNCPESAALSLYHEKALNEVIFIASEFNETDKISQYYFTLSQLLKKKNENKKQIESIQNGLINLIKTNSFKYCIDNYGTIVSNISTKSLQSLTDISMFKMVCKLGLSKENKDFQNLLNYVENNIDSLQHTESLKIFSTALSNFIAYDFEKSFAQAKNTLSRPYFQNIDESLEKNIKILKKLKEKGLSTLYLNPIYRNIGKSYEQLSEYLLSNKNNTFAENIKNYQDKARRNYFLALTDSEIFSKNWIETLYLAKNIFVISRDKTQTEGKSYFTTSIHPLDLNKESVGFLNHSKFDDLYFQTFYEQANSVPLKNAVDNFKHGSYKQTINKVLEFLAITDPSSARPELSLNSNEHKLAFLLLAHSYFKFDLKIDAIELLENLIKLNPNWEGAYSLLSYIYLNEKSDQLAFLVSSQALEKIPLPPYFLLRNYLVASFNNDSFFDRAQQRLAYENKDKIGTTSYELLNALKAKHDKKPEEACKIYNKIIYTDINLLSDMYNHYACQLVQENDHNKLNLLQNLQKKYSIDSLPDFYYLTAIAEFYSSNPMKSKPFFESFIQVTESPNSKYKLSQLYLKSLE